MRQIVIIISVILFGGVLRAQDCHSIPLEEVALELTPEVNGYYETKDAAIASGDVAQATRSFVDGLEKSIASQSSIPIELVYVRDRDHGIATDVWYHQKVNGDTLQHCYTRIRINAKNQVDYVYVKLALEADSVQAHSLKITQNPTFSNTNSTQISWDVNLGVPEESACASDIMELTRPYRLNDFAILYSLSGDRYLRGRFANMIDGSQPIGSDYRIKDDGDHDCKTDTTRLEQNNFIAGNMMFYVNDFIYWLADRFINTSQEDLQMYLNQYFLEKILMRPFHSLSGNAISETQSGSVNITLGSGVVNSQPDRGHDPDYILSAAFEAYEILANKTEEEIEQSYLISFSDVLTRLYWADFTDRHTNLPDNEPDRITNPISPDSLNRRVKTFGGVEPDNHIVVPDTANLPEYDSTMSSRAYIEFLNQLWYGVYDKYDNKAGFYDLLELVWVDLNTVPRRDHAAFMELLEKHLTSQFYDRANEDGKGSAQAFSGLSGTEYEEILEYILLLHGDQASVFVSLPLEDYYIKDAGDLDCPTFSSETSETCADNDRGLEPNEDSGGFASASIWNCPPGQPDCDSHQSAIYRLVNDNPVENTLRVRVHPIFDIDNPDSLNGTLDLYTVVTTTSISWASWGGEGPFEFFLPDCEEGGKELVIGRKVGSVPLDQFYEIDSNGVRIYNVPWIPFNPQDFKGCYSDWNGDRVHSCVLAVLQTDQDSFDLGDKSWRIVPNNNNAAARNMSTIWDESNLGPNGDNRNSQNAQIVHFMSGSPTSAERYDTVSISLENVQSTLNSSAEKYLKEGRLNLWLSDELRAAMSRAELSKSSRSSMGKHPSSDGWLRIENPDFRVDRLVLQKGKVYRALVSYDLDRAWQEDEVFGFDLVQRNLEGCESGGVRFEARRKTEPLPEPAITSDLTMYPNPTDNQVTVQLSEDMDIQEIELYSLSGQLIRNFKLPNQGSAFQVNTQPFLTGIYVIRVLDSTGRYHYGKLVKK